MDRTAADAIADIVSGLRPLHDDLALPDLCEIQHTVETRDSRGNPVTTWETLAVSRCAVDVSGMAGREYVVGGVETTDMPYIVTMPYDAPVTTANRLIVEGRIFEITDVRRGEGFEIATTVACREVSE